MSLNLKNEETERLARELARLTGENLTSAITEALKERLNRELKARTRSGRLEWLKKVRRETAAIMNDGRTSAQLVDELYHPETGLPR